MNEELSRKILNLQQQIEYLAEHPTITAMQKKIEELESRIEDINKEDEKTKRYVIRVTLNDLKQILNDTLNREATDEEAEGFKEYLELDLGTWLSDNAKTFKQALEQKTDKPQWVKGQQIESI